ncbi:mitochondrial inner membrane protein [Mycena filopes]|nr:mitochondrial inner membrane protein [Mycena filopes]
MASSLLASSSKRALARRGPVFAKTLLATRAAATQSSDALYGTVNDPTSFPTPSRVHGSHHWSFERLLSAGLIPLTGAAFATSPSVHPVLDGLLGVSLVFDSIIVDYLHPHKFPMFGHVATWTLRTTTVGVALGVYQFNTNDIGFTELVANRI